MTPMVITTLIGIIIMISVTPTILIRFKLSSDFTSGESRSVNIGICNARSDRLDQFIEFPGSDTLRSWANDVGRRQRASDLS